MNYTTAGGSRDATGNVARCFFPGRANSLMPWVRAWPANLLPVPGDSWAPAWLGCSHGAPSSCASYHLRLGGPLLHLEHLQDPTTAKLLLYTSHEWTCGSPTSPPCTYYFIPVSTSETCQHCLRRLSLRMWAACVFSFSPEIFAWATGFLSAPVGRGASFSHFSILSWSIEVSQKGRNEGLTSWHFDSPSWKVIGVSTATAARFPTSLFNSCSFATLDDKH